MIKNAIIYSVVMPQTVAEMSKFIEDANYYEHKPSSAQVRTFGYRNHPVSGQYVTPFTNGYCIVFREWKKNIKASLVNHLVNEKLDGRVVNRKEKAHIKDEVLVDLLAKTEPEPKDIYVYYNTKENVLIVNSTTSDVAESCLAMLRKTIGSLKTTTLHVDSRIGLTNRLVEFLKEGDPHYSFVEGLVLHDRVQLSGYQKEKLTYNDVDLFDENTVNEIESKVSELNMYVTNINLGSSQETIDFTLTDGFKFKKITYGDFDTNYGTELVNWDAVVTYCVSHIIMSVNCLLKAFTVIEEKPIKMKADCPYTYESLKGAGWTDQQIIDCDYGVK